MTDPTRCPCPRRHTRCDRPLDGTAYACRACAEHLADRLHTAANLAGDLETTIARLGRTSTHNPTTDRHPQPANLDAAHDAEAVRNTVTTWARHVADTRGLAVHLYGHHVVGPLCRAGWGCRHHSCADIRTRRTADPLAATMRWLATQVTWLRHRPEAEEAVDELLDACRLTERTVDRRGPRWYAGPCDAQLPGGQTCDTDLHAPTGAQVVRCPACGAEYDADARRNWLLDLADDSLHHAELIARALTGLGVLCTGSTVRNLAHRGRVTAHGHDTAGRPLYRVGDVREVLAEIEHARQVAELRRAEREARKAEQDKREDAA